jgi:hypothetical protein
VSPWGPQPRTGIASAARLLAPRSSNWGTADRGR